ncbi:MAG: DUF3445 domain-containing protein [Planctomycetaceae bacterium]|nr:MAG: DUF3445 domain-containing protein [Planctomycetaceae bacterium]
MSKEDPERWLLPDEDHRFSLGIHPGNALEFFGPSVDRERLLAERRRWLTDDSSRYAAVLPNAEACLAEVEALAGEWGFVPRVPVGSQRERLLDLGRQLEPDLVLLAPDESGSLNVVGGCVCFPSFWRLTDKLGLPVEAVHAPVPGLNASLGPAIDRYLSRMKPGSCWLRANWGLASRPDLNEHPDLSRPGWQRPLSLEQVWLRREDQAIVSLPASGGVLFGIRVVVRSVAELARSPDKALRLARGLRTMPAELVRYKGFEDVRCALIEMLGAEVSADAHSGSGSSL